MNIFQWEHIILTFSSATYFSDRIIWDDWFLLCAGYGTLSTYPELHELQPKHWDAGQKLDKQKKALPVVYLFGINFYIWTLG